MRWKKLLLVAPMGTFSLPGEENLSEQGSVYRWGYNLPTSLPILGSSVFQCTSAEKIVAETWSLVQSWTVLRGGKGKPLCKMGWWRNNIRQTVCRQITFLSTATNSSEEVPCWGCWLFLFLAEAAVLDEEFHSFADLFITSMVLENTSFPSSPTSLSFLQSCGWAMALRREHHLPACLWAIWTASVGQAAETGY